MLLPGMAAYVSKPSDGKMEEGKSGVQRQSGLHEALSQRTK